MVDFVLLFISLFFSLSGFLLEEIVSMGAVFSILKYFPILILYIKYFRWDFASILPILFSLFLFSISSLGGHYSFLGMIVTMMSPVSLFVFTRIRLSRKQIDIVKVMLVTAYLFHIFITIIVPNNIYINPNRSSFTLLILTVDIFFCAYINRGGKSITGSPGLIMLLVISFFLIVLTKGRNSLLVYLMLIMAFLFRKWIDKMNIWGLIMFCLLILFILYPFFYCLLSDSATYSSQNTEMMGQDIFSGREIIWSYIFAQLTDASAFWFGGIDTEWWGKSMHNSALDIVVRYGVPTMVVMELIVLYYFKRFCTIINYSLRSLLILVIVTMIWGLNESGIFLGLSFFVFLPYGILHSGGVESRKAS